MHRLGFLAVLLAAAGLCVPTYYLGLQITWILGTIGYVYTLVLSCAIMVAAAYVLLSTSRIVVGLILAIVLTVLGASSASEVVRTVGWNDFLLVFPATFWLIGNIVILIQGQNLFKVFVQSDTNQAQVHEETALGKQGFLQGHAIAIMIASALVLMALFLNGQAYNEQMLAAKSVRLIATLLGIVLAGLVIWAVILCRMDRRPENGSAH